MVAMVAGGAVVVMLRGLKDERSTESVMVLKEESSGKSVVVLKEVCDRVEGGK